MEPLQNQKFIRSVDAANYLGIANSTLAKMRMVGTSPPFAKIGRSVLYEVADLDSYVQNLKRSATFSI